jgi:hypothetical protein
VPNIKRIFLALAFTSIALPLLAYPQSVQPPPANLKVVEQPDCPLRVAIDSVRSNPRGGALVSYSVTNVGPVGVMGFAISGLPGRLQKAVPLETALLPSASRSFVVISESSAEIEAEHEARIDFVLRSDGQSWGVRTYGEAEYLVSFFEGVRRVTVDAKAHVAAGDRTKLEKFINSPAGFPAWSGDMSTWTRKEEGYFRGYNVGLISFRESLKLRGDTKGIPGRIADLEGILAADIPLTGQKRISMSAGIFEMPINIIGIAIDKNPVSLDEPMPARADWLNGLTLRVKNVSGRTIKRIAFDLDFPEVLSMGNRMSYPLHYGPLPIPGQPTPSDAEGLVQPDAVVEIRLDGKRFDGLKKFLERRRPLDSLSRMNISFQYVHYAD